MRLRIESCRHYLVLVPEVHAVRIEERCSVTYLDLGSDLKV